MDARAVSCAGMAIEASAAAKSACRSSRSSSPTDTRSRPGVIPASSSSRLARLAVRRRRRVDDHRVDAAERGGQLRQPERIDHGATGDPAALDLEREHPAGHAGPELATGDRVLRMAGQARVEHGSHARLTLEPARQCRGGPGMALGAHGEREDPAEHEERLERPEAAAGLDLDALDLGDQLAGTGHDPGDQVAVTAQELRRRFDDEVRPELERAADVGRRERVVDDVAGAVPVGELGELRVIGEEGRRVGDRLRVQDPGRGGREGVARRRRDRSCRRSRPGPRSRRTCAGAGRPRRAVLAIDATTRSPARRSDASVAWMAPIPDARASPASPPASSA